MDARVSRGDGEGRFPVTGYARIKARLAVQKSYSEHSKRPKKAKILRNFALSGASRTSLAASVRAVSYDVVTAALETNQRLERCRLL